MTRFIVEVEGRRMTIVSTVTPGSPSSDSAHTGYCLGRNDVKRDLGAFRTLISGTEASSVVELFGGSGWHSAAIQDLVCPRVHLALDIAQDCIDSIRASLPTVTALKADSYRFAREGFRGRTFDWVHADFNQFTLNRAINDRQYAGVLDGIFKAAQRRVTLTDSALFGIIRFKKNLDSYSAFFGKTLHDWGAYYRAASTWYFKHYGFSIQRVITWDGMCSMYALEKSPPAAFSIQPQTEMARVRLIKELP